jgi:anthranilate synthase component 2
LCDHGGTRVPWGVAITSTAVIIDNFDSFTYNIAQYLAVAGARTVVLRNTAELADIVAAGPTHLVLSPGPGTVDDPASYGVTFQALDHYLGRLPILGVCLGHQAIGRYFGGKITQLAEVRHGHLSPVRQIGRPALFSGVAPEFPAMRYHSLAVDPDTLPAELRITARSLDDDVVMAFEHVDLPVHGVQFHPESIGTPDGLAILANLLTLGGSR